MADTNTMIQMQNLLKSLGIALTAYYARLLCLFVCLFKLLVCSFVKLFVCLFVSLFVCLFVSLLVCLFVSLFVCLLVC